MEEEQKAIENTNLAHYIVIGKKGQYFVEHPEVLRKSKKWRPLFQEIMARVSDDSFEMYADPQGALYVLSVAGVYYFCFAEFNSHPEVIRELLENIRVQFELVQRAHPDKPEEFCYYGRLEAILYYQLMEYNNIRMDRFQDIKRQYDKGRLNLEHRKLDNLGPELQRRILEFKNSVPGLTPWYQNPAMLFIFIGLFIILGFIIKLMFFQ